MELSKAKRDQAARSGQSLLMDRSSRPPDYASEVAALSRLMDGMARSPSNVLADLSQAVVDLLSAGSGGVSLLKQGPDGDALFYWPSVIGEWSPFAGGEMPRDASPCGVVIDTDSILLFENPHQIFPAAGRLSPLIREVMVAPFHVGGEPVGTVWAIHHDTSRFDKEDARLLVSLSRFASAAYQSMATDKMRRQSDRQLESLAQALPNHVWTADAHGTPDWFNERAYAYSGVPPTMLNGSGWGSIVHPQDLESAASDWNAAVQASRVYETQFRLRAADGHYRWHLARAVPVLADDGAIVRWVGTNTDIEDQKRASLSIEQQNAALEQHIQERTAELLRTQAQLRQSQKMEAIGQLTGGIAHDFNNMLAVILGSLNLVERRQKSGLPCTEFIAAAKDGATRAAELTHRLLAFSRQLPLALESVDVGGMVKSMSELLRRTVGDSIRLETCLAEGLWRANTDVGQLENAILNLAINARDAMPEGGRLTIETFNARLDDDYARGQDEVTPGQYVLVAVSDSGTGITAEHLTKVFDPFFTTKDVGKGTGLGLSQVFGYVKQSKGHINIYSEPGHGTTVKVYLPRSFAEPASVVLRSQPIAVTPKGSPHEVILVVEDDDRLRETSTALLRDLGYTVLHRSSGARALEVLRTHPQVTLLFTDMVMPDMGGRQLANEASKLRSDLKILFTTGYTRNAMMHNEVLDQRVRILSKPFTLDQIGKKIRETLESSPADNPSAD